MLDLSYQSQLQFMSEVNIPISSLPTQDEIQMTNMLLVPENNIELQEPSLPIVDTAPVYPIQHTILGMMTQWENVKPISPIDFLRKLLKHRGYNDITQDPIHSSAYRR
jgi:hypothetical protein